MNYNISKENARRRRNEFCSTERNDEPVMKELNIISCLNSIVKKFSEDNYSEKLLAEISEATSYVCGKLPITPIQCLLLAVIAEESLDSGSASMNDICSAFGLTNLEMRGFMKEIDEMSKKHIVRIVKRSHDRGRFLYEVYADAMDAITNDKVYVTPSYTNIGTEQVFSEMRKLFSEYYDDALSEERLEEALRLLIDSNLGSIFCKKVKELDLTKYIDFVFFLYLCHRYGSHGNPSADVERIVQLLNEDCDTKRVERTIKRGGLDIQKKKLVEYEACEGLIDTSTLTLSENIQKDFFTELKIETEAKNVPNSPDFKDHASIAEKELFYNATEGEQIERLARLLKDENFKGIQQRLEEQGLRKGVNIIMYGPAGTGKTESCLQLARQTGRDLFVVDVAKIKSKWVGDSEKSIRGLFSYYRTLVANSEKAPILLFNEADAIFGIRMKGAENAVDKMENSIQNIILQEMETLDGILIATTNLETNLDPAFERRFLFKIRFSMPEQDAREKIWESMMPDLSKKDARFLAKEYAFSGGQIENVKRKCTIDYILNGKKAGLDELTKYCNEEHLGPKSSNAVRIGFE